MKTGVELIAIERNEKQIIKHGFTAEHHAMHPEWYNKGQLIKAAQTLSTKEIKNWVVPLNWDVEWFKTLCLRSHEDRLIIAGALLASEWDRLDYLQNKQITESGIQLSKGMLVYFIGEKAPMEVKAVNENFAICTRPLHRWYDADLLKHEVEMGAYLTFMEAYNDLKNEIIYTIIDFTRNIKAPHNLVLGGYDFKNQKDIDKLLKDLQTGETELSERNKAVYNLDFERTLNQ